MSEKRKKDYSILLRTQGKMPDESDSRMDSLELFKAEQWPDEASAAGLLRVRVNDVWHCPTGKYSFLTWPVVGELVTTLLMGGKVTIKPDVAPYLPYKADVRVHLVNDLLPRRGSVQAPPHQEIDGRWYVWVWVHNRGPKKVPCDDVTLIRVR